MRRARVAVFEFNDAGFLEAGFAGLWRLKDGFSGPPCFAVVVAEIAEGFAAASEFLAGQTMACGGNHEPAGGKLDDSVVVDDEIAGCFDAERGLAP